MDFKRSWKTFWCDRRGKDTHIMMLFLLIYIMAFASIAYAASISETINDPITWKLIGVIQVLLAFIYISGQRSSHKKFDKLFDRVEKLADRKMDKDEHDRICPKIVVKLRKEE